MFHLMDVLKPSRTTTILATMKVQAEPDCEPDSEDDCYEAMGVLYLHKKGISDALGRGADSSLRVRLLQSAGKDHKKVQEAAGCTASEDACAEGNTCTAESEKQIVRYTKANATSHDATCE